MTDTTGILVVGASQAGVQLVASLRDFGWDGPITLVGAEAHLPYQRPPLSKRALLEGIEPGDLALRGAPFFRDHEVELILGDRVITVETSPGGDGRATTASGRGLPFARLALTVGARPRRLGLPGAGLAGVHVLRDCSDAERLRRALTSRGRVVVIGGGFIGLEVASTARQLGCDVHVVLADAQVMARAVSPVLSRHVHAAHEREGVAIRCRTRPAAFLDDGRGQVCGVQLEDGHVLPADIVVVGVGAEPRTELARRLGLSVEAGAIVVDHRAVTSDGVTLAAGDCTTWDTGDGALRRFESVNAATEQAKIAAATLTGHTYTWAGPPWFWSDQFDFKIQAAGRIPTHGTIVIRQVPGTRDLTVLHYDRDRLAAVECLNRPVDYLAARAAMAAGRTIAQDQAHDASVPLRSLIADVS